MLSSHITDLVTTPGAIKEAQLALSNVNNVLRIKKKHFFKKIMVNVGHFCRMAYLGAFLCKSGLLHKLQKVFKLFVHII